MGDDEDLLALYDDDYAITIVKRGDIISTTFGERLPMIEVLGMLEMAKDTALRTCCGDWDGPDGDVTDGGA